MFFMSKNFLFARFRLACILFFAFGLSACTTHYGAINIQSSPPGAQVFDMEDGFYIGVTPLNYVWKSKDAPRKFMNIRMHKPGYEDLTSTFWLSLGNSTAKTAKSNPQSLSVELKTAAE
jgi:hypothetical protein